MSKRKLFNNFSVSRKLTYGKKRRMYKYKNPKWKIEFVISNSMLNKMIKGNFPIEEFLDEIREREELIQYIKGL